MSISKEKEIKINNACANGYCFDAVSSVRNGGFVLSREWDLKTEKLVSNIYWWKTNDGHSCRCVTITLYDNDGEFLKCKTISERIPIRKKSMKKLVDYTFKYGLQECKNIIEGKGEE